MEERVFVGCCWLRDRKWLRAGAELMENTARRDKVATEGFETSPWARGGS